MFGGGRGPMGGGGGMLRAAGRAITRTGVANGGIQDPFASSPSSSTAGNASFSHGGAFSFINSGAYEDFEWVSEEGTEEDDSVFGSVPSVDEVQNAVSTLQQVFDGSSYSQLVRDRYESYQENGGGHQSPIATGMVHQVPSFGSDLDWMEPSMQLCHSKILQPHAYDQVYNAFDLLRTESSVQLKMEGREENPHERLKQQFSELEQEWTAMKTGKSSSAVTCITVEEALQLVENSPRKLMLSLQNEQVCPEGEMVPTRSPCRRKLFPDSDDDEERTWLCHSSCWSSNVMRVRDNNNNKKKKTRGRIVYVSLVLLLLWVLVVLMNGFDHLSMNRQIDTLVPT